MEIVFTSVAILCFAILGALDVASANNVFNVVDYGAVGDAVRDEADAFNRAWWAACQATGAVSTLLIPAGRTFVLKPVIFSGGCRASRMHIQIDGNVLAANRQEMGNAYEWIMLEYLNTLTIGGSGKLDGRGSDWWPKCPPNQGCQSPPYYRPTLLTFQSCHNVLFNGNRLSLVNSPRNHININGCSNLTISNIDITVPGNTINTDGINIGNSRGIYLSNLNIQSGDDCISILNNMTNVHINSIVCGPGHGISIGSLGKKNSEAQVSDIHVKYATFTNTENGVRIKTWQGGRGHAKDITFKHITMNSVENPIIIDQYYFDSRNLSSAVAVSNVEFHDIKGSGSRQKGISLACSKSIPCRNIIVADVKLHAAAGGSQLTSYCLSVFGPRCKGCSPHVPIPCPAN